DPGKTRCEIALPEAGCPGDASKPRTFDDEYENANKDVARCMRRALEYYDWCGSGQPVIARYFDGATMKREQKGERKTRCEIHFSKELCPGNPREFRRQRHDDVEGSSANEARCMKRALEYYDWCGSSMPVIARYFDGASLK